jgi:hypothetical protein
MKDQKEKSENGEIRSDQSQRGNPADCTCVTNPYASLPPELRPKPKSTMGGLRKVTCPNCGLKYWTNRQTDLCIDCETRAVKYSETKQNTGE